jgi:F-type H+-transporting ATPase subunit b
MIVMAFDATFFALVGLILFLALIAYLKVPGMLTKSLDQRAVTIRNELDEAKRLREEAQQLLAEYQRKRKEAEAEAAQIVAAAEREAAAITEEARHNTEEFVARRNALSEQKIRQAEADAIGAVRSAAVDLAVAAAEKVIALKADAATQQALFSDGIATVKTRLN